MRIFIFISIILVSCNTQRRVEKATQIVITNKNAFDTVGSVWASLHPCVSDTVINNISDTSYGETLIYTDTVYVPKEQVKYIYKTITKSPTVIEKKSTAYVTDYRQVHDLAEQIQKLKINNANLNVDIYEKNSRIEDEKKRGNKLLYWLIGIIVLLIGSHILRSYIKI